MESSISELRAHYRGNMELYASVKQVWAEPMTLGEFHRVKDQFSKSSDGPIQGRENESGYHVLYNRDTPDEYHSWCPAHIFEAGNVLVEEEVSA